LDFSDGHQFPVCFCCLIVFHLVIFLRYQRMSREKEQKILDQGIGLPRAPEMTSRLLVVDSAPVSHEEWKADLQNKGYGKKKMPPQNHHNNDGCIYFSATLIMTFFSFHISAIVSRIMLFIYVFVSVDNWCSSHKKTVFCHTIIHSTLFTYSLFNNNDDDNQNNSLDKSLWLCMEHLNEKV